MSDITWENCTMRLGELKEWPDNPALISEKEAERLYISLGCKTIAPFSANSWQDIQSVIRLER